MNLKWNLICIILIEHFLGIMCSNKRKHYHHNHHSIVSATSVPQSLTAPIAEDNYNPEESMCIWKDDLDNIYNLSLLQKMDSYWEVDLRTTEQLSFKIQLIFNFCNNFPKIPCSNKSEFTPSGGEEKIQSENEQMVNYGAYQTLTFKNHQSMDSCSQFGQYDKSLIELIDYYEVGQGIKIVYKGGDICSQSENPMDQNKQKSITFLIYCSSEKDDNFTSLPIDGISVTSCNPTLQINHPGGCYSGQMNAQRHKLSHPIFIFITLLIIFLVMSIIIIITVYNCLENGLKGFMAIPYYEELKLVISRSDKKNNNSFPSLFSSSLTEDYISQSQQSQSSYFPV